LWLCGIHRIASALGIERLRGTPVDFPVSALLAGIKAVRAHFYAGFHSGRKLSHPISRAVMRELTGVPERSQREYDLLARVARERNIAIGGKYTKANAEQTAWQKGRGFFEFHDVQAKQGRKGTVYVAWHLPNSYHGSHAKRSRTSQKRINRKLADLLMERTAGNDNEAIERIFWPNAKEAGRAYNRNYERDMYWSYGHTRDNLQQIWCVLPSQKR
jgi:hypothetical protein